MTDENAVRQFFGRVPVRVKFDFVGKKNEPVARLGFSVVAETKLAGQEETKLSDDLRRMRRDMISKLREALNELERAEADAP